MDRSMEFLAREPATRFSGIRSITACMQRRRLMNQRCTDWAWRDGQWKRAKTSDTKRRPISSRAVGSVLPRGFVFTHTWTARTGRKTVFYKKRILRRTSVLNKGRQNVVIEERFKMKRVLVVGLAVVLAAGNAFAGGGSLNNSSSTTTGSTSSGSTSSNSSSGSSGNSGTSAGQQGGARGGTANHPSGK